MFGLTGCALLIVKYLYFGKQTGTELNGNWMPFSKRCKKTPNNPSQRTLEHI